MTIPNSLDPGLYELLVTAGLGNVLDSTEASGLTTVTADVDSEDVAHVLTQHIASAVSNALQRTPQPRCADRVSRVILGRFDGVVDVVSG